MKRLLTILFLLPLLALGQSGILMVQKVGGGSVTPPPGGTYLSLSDALLYCHGNSLTQGQGSTASYPTQLAALSGISGVVGNVVNNGIGGQTTQQMMDAAPTDVDNWLAQPYSGPFILIPWEITNDLYYNGSVADAQTRFAAYCNARRTAGWDRIVTMTILHRSFTGTSPGGDTEASINAKIDQANTWLRANYGTFCDALADVVSDSRLQDTGNTTYFSDGTHLTNAGYGIVAQMVRDKLVTLE